MAARYPLIYNNSAEQIQEIPDGDELNLSGADIGVGIVSATAFANKNLFTSSVSFANTALNYAQVGPVAVGAGATISVGAGISYVVI